MKTKLKAYLSVFICIVLIILTALIDESFNSIILTILAILIAPVIGVKTLIALNE